MEKTVIRPDWFDVSMAYAVVTHRGGYRRVVFSGAAHDEGDLEEQARTILEHKRAALSDLGGSMDDVTAVRIYVREDVLSREAQSRIDDVRAEFFGSPHYPASTMVGVADLLAEDALLEVEVEAEIPDDDWETEVITGGE